MNYRNRLMILSFIVLAVFSACTDEVENGGQRPVKGDHSLSFAVSTPGAQTWTKADGTHAASALATQELEPVEMEGKVNGKTVYLSAEVTDGFPGDNRPMTRGTQVTDDNKAKDGIMETFAVSAYTDITGTADFMYSVPTTKGSPENGTYYWYPEDKFYWPGVKSLNFYAWYPHTANAEGLTVSGADENGTPKLVKVEVTFMNTDNTEFTVGASLSGTWEKGKTYIYKISYNFVYIGVSNEKFVAYVDKTDEMKDQIAFYVNFNSSDPNDTRMILYPENGGLTVTPKTITPGSNIPIKVSWDGKKGWLYASLAIAKSEDDVDAKMIWIIRPNTEGNEVQDGTNIFEEDGGFWVYSLPETTSQPFKDEYSDGDIVELQNVSESDWLAITPLSTYNKNVKYQAIYKNSSKGDIYLQTLSVPTENRFASLLACKEDFKQNIMYCVEQKALTADFGFKDCERNISREAEKWNIVVDATGARLKDDVTKLQARVVISSSIDDTQISDLGRDLTYGDPASIYIDKATMTGISAKPYVKKRWDNGVNDATNNGERTVNVQVKRADSDDWCDIDTKGTMSDRFYWGKNYCIGTDTYYAGETTKNDWNDCAAKILTAYWKVHKNHPLFGLYKWTIPRLDTKADVNTNPLYAVHSASKGLNGLNVNSLYGVVGLSPNMLYQGCTKVTSIVDPDNPQSAWNAIYNNDIGTFMVGGKGDWPNNWDASWSDGAHCAQWYPIVYAADYCESSDRPTDEHPISGKSVNE